MSSTVRRAEIVALVAAMVGFSAPSPCHGREPFENQWGPFTGAVVDADTGQPIPGAVFTVIWMERISHLIGTGSEKFLDARVAVTDEQGHFDIPQRSRPFLIFSDAAPPFLSCIDPEYFPFDDVDAQNAPVAVKMRRLRTAEERRLGLFSDAGLGTIPRDKASQFEEVINQSRDKLGLRPIKFPWGGYRKGTER